FIQSALGVQYRLSFGASVVDKTGSGVSLGNFGISNENSALELIKVDSDWIGFSIDLTNRRLVRQTFPTECTASPAIFQGQHPTGVRYSTGGAKNITLMAISASGVISSQSRTVMISSSLAPDIDFTLANVCVNHAVIFTPLNTSGTISTYSWSFGDSNTSSQVNPINVYSNAGEYLATLTVTAANSCENFAQELVTIYNQPTADFSLPLANPFCTNQSYNFGNTSSFDVASNPKWEWSLNGIVVSSTFDLSAQFSSNQPQQIKLKSMIPGCESEIIKNISSVQVGAAPDFEFSNGCQGASITFTNTTRGAVVDYAWDFDDGNISSQQNGINSYMNSGLYQVTLQATNASGCQNFVTKPITIYSQPQPNFSLDLPPFSCAGSPSQFNDLTPPLTDSNITSRLWSFGDANNGTSIQANPRYIYNQDGDYLVSLGVSSNFGCSNTIQKTITIQPSPTVNFSNTPACLNQPTQFTDASGADVKAWLWSIQNMSYTTKNVTHAFNTTGLQNAMLTVTGNNNCVSQISKTIAIPVPVSIDFNSQSTCATKPSIFTETNSGGVDPAVSSTWDFAGQPGSGSPVQHVFSSVGSYPVNLSSTRLSGCVYSVTKSVNIVQPPVARFTMTPENGGAPLTVDFTNTSVSATNFLWNFNDASNSTSAQFSPSFVFDQLGTYAVELIASNAIGCTDSVKKDVQVVVPQINAVLSEFRLESSTGGTLIATVTVENKGNITITNPEIYLDLSGNTEVKERLTGTIPPDQFITRTLTTSILPDNLSYACAEVFITGDSNAFDNRECTNLENEITFIQPYPNPANDIIYLDWINQNLESLQVIIYNSSGQAVLNQTYYNLLHGLNQVEINVSQLAPGIYLASYSTGNNPYSFKFSVIR
ncbi:MAG TPA: PKD domain-containing protein, partial [Cyclobacteriaceae bacterium]|nr:PKD domain-containing protein [Cyclobacteriaceae bacterium]